MAKKLVIPLFERWEERRSGLLCKKTGYFSSVQSLSRVGFFVTPWTTACPLKIVS